jgi:hypothetical protein
MNINRASVLERLPPKRNIAPQKSFVYVDSQLVSKSKGQNQTLTKQSIMEMNVGKLGLDRPIVNIARSRLSFGAASAGKPSLSESHPLSHCSSLISRPTHKFREDGPRPNSKTICYSVQQPCHPLSILQSSNSSAACYLKPLQRSSTVNATCLSRDQLAFWDPALEERGPQPQPCCL